MTEDEIKKQKEIEEKLVCEFMWWNSDDPEFNIFRLINKYIVVLGKIWINIMN